MDSISENVVAMIAVVVGILIIGTALVPIVQHASSGTETTEVVTGSNEIDMGELFIPVTNSHMIELSLGVVTIDGVTTQENVRIINDYFSENPSFVCIIEPLMITVGDNDQQLISGTVALTASQAIITGVGYDDNSSYSETFALTDAVISSAPTTIASAAPGTDVYGEAVSATIGDGQAVYVLYGFPDVEFATITTHSTASPTSAATLTKNDNGTVTVTVNPDEGMLYAPMEWSQTVTTSEGSSQYAALYGIIPIMCILAMAYVLIRRF